MATIIWATFSKFPSPFYTAYGYFKGQPIRMENSVLGGFRALTQPGILRKIREYSAACDAEADIIGRYDDGQLSPNDWLFREEMTREERDRVYGLSMGLMLGCGAAANQPEIDRIERLVQERLDGVGV